MSTNFGPPGQFTPQQPQFQPQFTPQWAPQPQKPQPPYVLIAVAIAGVFIAVLLAALFALQTHAMIERGRASAAYARQRRADQAAANRQMCLSVRGTLMALEEQRRMNDGKPYQAMPPGADWVAAGFNTTTEHPVCPNGGQLYVTLDPSTSEVRVHCTLESDEVNPNGTRGVTWGDL